LESGDESTLHFVCKTYSLSLMGTKVDVLRRLRMFAGNRSKEDRRRQLGWRGRVESNLEQRQARRAIEEGDAFDDDAGDEIQGYFFMPQRERR